MKRACCGAQKMTLPVESNQFCKTLPVQAHFGEAGMGIGLLRASPCPGAWGYVLPQVLAETNPGARCSEAALTLRRRFRVVPTGAGAWALARETEWEREAHRCRLESALMARRFSCKR
jgi:hypothetical protein